MLEFAKYGYWGLFLASFLSATVLPFSSEAVFSAMVYGGLDAWACVGLATLGNWLGALTCYWLGYLGKTEWIEKYLHVSHQKVEHYKAWFHRHGEWIAFFSFVPFIGDILAVTAGFMRSRFWLTALFMLAGKALRYVVWMMINNLWM